MLGGEAARVSAEPVCGGRVPQAKQAALLL